MAERTYRQRVPRPETIRRSDVPCWGAHPPASVPIARVFEAVGQLPAHHPAAPPRSAVLVPIFEVDGEANLLLICRASGLTVDPGHIAFPGGRIEPGELALDAALREAEEEVGIARDEVRVLGALPVANRYSDQQRVAPYLGFLTKPPRGKPNQDEVERTIVMPIAALFADGVGWQEEWTSPTRGERTVRFFAEPGLLGDDLIWGLTARILWELLELIVEPSRTPSASSVEE